MKGIKIANELEAKGEIAGNKGQTASSTRGCIENLSRNGQNQNITPKESITPIKPTQDKTTNANDALKMAREKLSALKR